MLTLSLCLQLVDLCLASIDPPLYAHLLASNLTAEIYAFPSILTFCAATPPLREVLELWDFLLAWGPGLNVLCVVAQLGAMREALLSEKSCVRTVLSFTASVDSSARSKVNRCLLLWMSELTLYRTLTGR